ncbi:MAG: 16S rRNA (cytosine(1402)-N(4))-methyltransferase RsmH [Deltaproteobacteria bacterium]|nr:16S rRNA (cytosine(1402)-N(4))-methyltransferase RsmH [Deltaproteobacteria bacterium]
MAGSFSHTPALLSETLEYLAPFPHGSFVDGTLGGGGHAAEILERSAPDGILIGLDRDPDALHAARERLAGYGERLRTVQASFRDLTRVLEQLDQTRVDGVLLDLGVSSPQLDRRERGFSFAHTDAPLDMRMDRDNGETAADLLARLSSAELARTFREYGDLRGSRRLAAAIVDARRSSPLRTVGDLVAVIEAAGVGRGRKHNPATLVFQALRIAVNDELEALGEGLEAAIDALRPGRCVVVLAYHSLEDRIVKNHLRDAARRCTCPPEMPVCVCAGVRRVELLTRRPVRPTPEEVRANPRARSARLRAARRLPEAV